MFFKRGQVIFECCVLLAVTTAAFLAMSFYAKGGMQGRFRQLGDNIGQQYSRGNTQGLSQAEVNYFAEDSNRAIPGVTINFVDQTETKNITETVSMK